jgi:hypothetical protein
MLNKDDYQGGKRQQEEQEAAQSQWAQTDTA